MDGDWHAAWVSALDELELDVEQTERMLRCASWDTAPARTGWAPPALAGQLPADLRARAAAILARQLSASDELTRTISGNRRLAALSSRLDPGTRRERPVYLDRGM